MKRRDSKRARDIRHDEWRRKNSPHRQLYQTAQWKALRKQRLAAEPLCRMCRNEELLTAASIVDHVTPHRGNVELFFDYYNTQSLCDHHHNKTKQSMERGGVVKDTRRLSAKDGWPITGGE